ncbi:MAG: hypothetical protein CXT70_03945 [Methanobacteriota archaeon]|nr:MAG: hypothetical protein CXT70_03945 [Euryarchaeota archaeon]
MEGEKVMELSPALIIKKRHGETVYHFLKQKKWLQSEKHPREIENDLLAIPINEICPLTEDEISIIIHEERIDIRIENIEMITNPPSVEPHARLHQFITQWLQSNLDIVDTIPHRSKEEMMRGLLSELPKRWEKLGDLILLPQTAFSSEKWISIICEENQLSLWKCIAEALKVERIGKQKSIKGDVIRSSQAQLLLGDSSWVELLDYGVKFGFDACKVMYSSGNVTERHRIGNMDMKGEIPMLVRGDAELVHACEINHHSITALEWGAKANNVSDRLIIHQGDNALTMTKLEGIADRCHLGLLPSSQSAWKLAIACLKEKGKKRKSNSGLNLQ